MAMNSAVLISAIKARMKSELGYDLATQEKGSPLDIMIEETVKHIQTFAVVNTTVTTAVAVASATALSPGVPGAGTGAGAGVGKVA